MNPGSIPRLPPQNALLICAANWLVPGLGFILVGDRARGVTLFVLLTACFVIGVLLGGYILQPTFSMRSPEFNLVAILTYLTQACFAGGWLALQGLHAAASGNPEGFFNLQRLAASNAYSDIGSFHLIVAGGMNYLSTIRLYDLLTGQSELSAPDYRPETEAKP